MELLLDPQAWIALVTLTVLEIVLGVDNIIFITILVGRLAARHQARARLAGLSLALLARIGLLLSISWVISLTDPVLEIAGRAVSWRDIILIAGGLFLLWKSVHEIHGALEGANAKGADEAAAAAAPPSPWSVIGQIAVIDIVFSLDSVITAVGMVNDVPVMVAAIVLAVLVMMVSAKGIGDFVERRPTIKMLALAFLTLIGFTLVAEGLGVHVPKGYIYFAMAFSFGVEVLNLRARGRRAVPVRLRKSLRAGRGRR